MALSHSIRLPSGVVVRRVVESNSAGHFAQIAGRRVQLRRTQNPPPTFEVADAYAFDGVSLGEMARAIRW